MRDVKVRPKELERVRCAITNIQGGKCGLCGQAVTPGAAKRPAMDHNHSTGYIRGVLCLYCNGMLGKIENASIKAGRAGRIPPLEWLRLVAEYLNKHSTPAWSIEGQRWGLIYPTHKTPEDKRLARLEKAKAKRRKAAALKKVK